MKIIRDTKEQTGWNFSFHDECEHLVVQGLRTGDYTVVGYEKDICIERKKSLGEVAANLGKLKYRFEREFERMTSFRFRYLICEFPVVCFDTFPEGSEIPRNRWDKLRVNGKFLYKSINTLCMKYDVIPYYCMNRDEAESKAIELMTDAVRELDGKQSF
jgi:hypothetical protein